MGKMPWFPFYSKDWLSSLTVQVMSFEERGIYITLLCQQWDSPYCSITYSRDDLIKVFGPAVERVLDLAFLSEASPKPGHSQAKARQ